MVTYVEQFDIRIPVNTLVKW